MERFVKVAEHAGVQAIAYSARFFKGNLHVYAYYGPVRGFDVSAVSQTAEDAERKLTAAVSQLWSDAPVGVRRAQEELLTGTRKARYPEDLEVLVKRRDSVPR